jgi:two-component system OmpR family response regulator
MTEKGAPLILIVDDEAEIRLMLRRLFEREGLAVCEAKDGSELFAALEHGPVSLITLDLRLGGEDGLELARRVRMKDNVPIVMISGKGDPIDKIVGLELGADDYISKPFHLREVLARVRAVLRRYETSAEASAPDRGRSGTRYRFSDWVLDISRRELCTLAGVRHELTTAEFNLLEIFVARPARVLSRDNLMDLLKGIEWSPVDRTIDNLVGRLRKKIEAQPDAPDLIKTVRGVGYVFTGEVVRQ